MMRAKSYAAVLAAFLLAWSGAEVRANQSNTWSPTTGIVSGLQLTTNYNNAFSAMQSCNSGAASPNNDQSGAPVQGQCWLNTGTTPFTMQQYDGAQWTTVGWLDTTNHQWIANVAGMTQSVAAATSTDLCNVGGVLTPSPSISITGSTTINGFGSSCLSGALKFVTFTSTPVLTHNASTFILPNAGFNIPAAPGDTLAAYALGGGAWKVLFYQPASGVGGVPSGTEAAFAGVSAPSGWTLEAGQAISRSTSPGLFSAITSSVTGTPANGSATISNVSVDLRNLGVEGAFVEGTGIPIGNFINSVTATTIVMNANATGGSGGEPIRILPWGQGDASTTFNIPDRRGIVIAGRDNMNGTAANRLTLAQSQGILGTKLGGGVVGGNIGGEQGHTQQLSELVNHLHAVFLNDPGHSHTTSPLSATSVGGNAGAVYGPSGSTATSSNTTGITVRDTTGGGGTANQTATAGTGSAANQVQPTGIGNYIIKN